MGRGILLYLLGVPIPIIILLALLPDIVQRVDLTPGLPCRDEN